MYEAIFFVFGVQVGFWALAIWSKLHQIKNSLLERKEIGPAVVRSSPETYREGKESSFVIEPKSPQMVEFEETEALRKINPGKY